VSYNILSMYSDMVDFSKTQVPRLKKQLIRELEKEMKASSISQGEIGRRLGMARTNVNKTLRARSSASLDQLVRIANAIDLEITLDTKRKR
jgi:transcriptional regulator with XRE-family HTH domain